MDDLNVEFPLLVHSCRDDRGLAVRRHIERQADRIHKNRIFVLDICPSLSSDKNVNRSIGSRPVADTEKLDDELAEPHRPSFPRHVLLEHPATADSDIHQRPHGRVRRNLIRNIVRVLIIERILRIRQGRIVPGQSSFTDTREHNAVRLRFLINSRTCVGELRTALSL